jgi:hypothetical protein
MDLFSISMKEKGVGDGGDVLGIVPEGIVAELGARALLRGSIGGVGQPQTKILQTQHSQISLL